MRSAKGAPARRTSPHGAHRTPHSALFRVRFLQPLPPVGAKNHRELIAWQLADAVRRRMIALMDQPDVAKDFSFCDQADRASSSGCRNLAEGYYRHRHKEFANFVNIARSSLGELLDSLDEARIKGYLQADDHAEFNAQVVEAMRVANGLYRYLRNNPDP